MGGVSQKKKTFSVGKIRYIMMAKNSAALKRSIFWFKGGEYNEMKREIIFDLFPELQMISNSELRDICADTWLLVMEESDMDINKLTGTLCHKSLKDCPVTLIDHTRGVIQLSIKIAQQFTDDFSQYVDLDMDSVIAAACLHDVGKVYEHRRDQNGELTWAAKNLHHPITGAAAALRMNCPPEIVYAISNHSHEGDRAKRTPLLFVIRNADIMYYEYLFFSFEKTKGGW